MVLTGQSERLQNSGWEEVNVAKIPSLSLASELISSAEGSDKQDAYSSLMFHYYLDIFLPSTHTFRFEKQTKPTLNLKY